MLNSIDDRLGLIIAPSQVRLQPPIEDGYAWQQNLDTLTSICNLASTYRNQVQWEEAEKLEVQVMETRKTKLGAEQPDTLTSMANFAFTWKT
ncbi:hypothetical protein N7532_001986 [Penicillium argentinense]|uniref:Uncharacterized protein n=1 Tax=Penicillium argentinense TaxID=1131581 RepID=A0A9W9KMY2_9EURO|nr:uncharacterized protein N7532_001986 [Penicillium argentinense]KAJ5111451.1 hypothetical protein N7532_001986 [Penicillium argentinense]